MKRINILSLMPIMTALCLILLVTACSSEPPPSTPTSPATPVPTPDVSATDEAADGSVEKSVQDLTVEDVVKTVAERTPVPSPTAGPVDRMVEQVATEAGIAGKSFLGLEAKDWINLGVSALIVLIGSLLIIPLFSGLLRWIVHRTKTQFDDDFLAAIGQELRWLVVIILAGIAAFRLEFWSDGQRVILDDLFFLLDLGVLYIIALRLVTFTVNRYLNRLQSESDRKRWDPIMTMLKRLGYFLVSLIALNFATSHFGVDTTLLAPVFIFLAVVIALAGKAIIDDAVSGFLILTDQPFRVNDDILIKELDTWGSVVEIGIRSTRMRVYDNREVIVPNSLIGQSQVVNYTYPDPTFRVQIDIGVAYDTNFDSLQQIITETVRGVEGVLPNKSVDVFFLAFGDSALQIRARWWIDSYNNQNSMLTRVNVALLHALDEAGIEIPYPIYDLNLKATGKDDNRAAPTLPDESDKA